MPDFEVNPPGICGICGEEKEPEELSELDGQLACLDCIAQANVQKNVPLEQLAASTHTSQPPRRRSRIGVLLVALVLLSIAGGAFYIRRVRHRQDLVRTSVTSLKTEGDNLARAGRLEEAIARYEAVLKQLQNKPLSDPQLVELYHQAEKSAAAPYLKIILPRLERVEAMLLAGRSEEARQQFRELANFINAHTVQPELSVRQRIDRVTDELRVPRIAKANWRKEIPAVAVGPTPPRITTKPIAPEEPNTEAIPSQSPSISSANPSPQPQPSAAIRPIPKPIAP